MFANFNSKLVQLLCASLARSVAQQGDSLGVDDIFAVGQHRRDVVAATSAGAIDRKFSAPRLVTRIGYCVLLKVAVAELPDPLKTAIDSQLTDVKVYRFGEISISTSASSRVRETLAIRPPAVTTVSPRRTLEIIS